MAWSGSKNAPLLERAAQEFDVVLTVDQGIEYQQNPVGLAVAIIVMVAMSNDIDDLRPLMTCIGVSPHHQLHLLVPEISSDEEIDNTA